MQEKTLTDYFVDYLKPIQQEDAKFIMDLFKTRIECNPELNEHTNIGYFYGTMNLNGELTDDPDDIPCISALGLINGFLCYMQNMDKNFLEKDFGKFERILLDFDKTEIENGNYANYQIMNTRDWRAPKK